MTHEDVESEAIEKKQVAIEESELIEEVTTTSSLPKTSLPPSNNIDESVSDLNSSSDIPIINKEKKGHQYDGILVFRPSESGLANNILGLVSAFIMSTLSNRKLYCSDFTNGWFIDSGNYAMDTIFTVHDYWGNEVKGISKIL